MPNKGLFVVMYVHPCIHLSINQSHPSISIHPSVCLSVRSSVCLSVSQFTLIFTDNFLITNIIFCVQKQKKNFLLYFTIFITLLNCNTTYVNLWTFEQGKKSKPADSMTDREMENTHLIYLAAGNFIPFIPFQIKLVKKKYFL